MARIDVGHDPRGVALTRDGRKLLVANRLEDTISVIDTRTNRVASTITLAGPKQTTVLRKGEQTFYTARYSFQGQIGCANCHIDSTFDGLTWDLEPDGFGRDIVDNRPIEGLKDTEPYKWNGGNPNLPTECGPRTEKYFWRAENYDDLTLTDLVVYIRSLPPRPNRWRLPGGELTPAQEHGKALFARSVDKFGNADPGDEPLRLLPQRTQGHKSEILRRGNEEGNRQLRTAGYSAAYEHCNHCTLSSRRFRSHA